MPLSDTDDDRAPLLSPIDESAETAVESGGKVRMLRRSLLGDGLAVLAQVGSRDAFLGYR